MHGLIVASTTDSPEQMNTALEHAGFEPNETEEIKTEGQKTEEGALVEEKSEPAGQGEKPADESKTAEPPEGSTEDQEKDKPKEGRGFQKRIDDLTREKYAEREARIAAEEKAKRLEQTIAEKNKPAEEPKAEAKPAEAAGKPIAPVAPKRPRQNQFDTFELYEAAAVKYDEERDAFEAELVAYQEKLADWTADQKIAKLKEQNQQTAEQKAQQTEAEERNAAWDARLEEVAPLYDDFKEVTEAIGKDVLVSAAMIDAITELELGPSIFYWLAKHPEEANRITELSTYDPNPKVTPILKVLAINRLVGREIAMIEAEVATEVEELKAAKGKSGKEQTEEKAKPAAAPEKKPIRASSAPAPIRPVSTRAANVTTDAGDKTVGTPGYTLADYAKTRTKH